MVPTCLPSLAPPYDGVTSSSAVAAAAKERICQPATYTHLDQGHSFTPIAINTWGRRGGGGGICTYQHIFTDF